MIDSNIVGTSPCRCVTASLMGAAVLFMVGGAAAATQPGKVVGAHLTGGAVAAAMSSDGRDLYVLDTRGAVVVVTVATGEVRQVDIPLLSNPKVIFRAWDAGVHVVAGNELFFVDESHRRAVSVRPGVLMRMPRAVRHAVRCGNQLIVTKNNGQVVAPSRVSVDPSVLNAYPVCTRNQSVNDGCKGWGARYVRAARYVACVGGELAAIQMGGTLRLLPVAEQDPLKLRWRKVGETPAWKDVVAAVGRGEFLFTAEKDGALWKTDMDGNRTKVIANGFAKTKFLLAAGPVKLVIIDADGNIYVVEV